MLFILLLLLLLRAPGGAPLGALLKTPIIIMVVLFFVAGYHHDPLFVKAPLTFILFDRVFAFVSMVLLCPGVCFLALYSPRTFFAPLGPATVWSSVMGIVGILVSYLLGVQSVQLTEGQMLSVMPLILTVSPVIFIIGMFLGIYLLESVAALLLPINRAVNARLQTEVWQNMRLLSIYLLVGIPWLAGAFLEIVILNDALTSSNRLELPGIFFALALLRAFTVLGFLLSVVAYIIFYSDYPADQRERLKPLEWRAGNGIEGRHIARPSRGVVALAVGNGMGIIGMTLLSLELLSPIIPMVISWWCAQRLDAKGHRSK